MLKKPKSKTIRVFKLVFVLFACIVGSGFLFAKTVSATTFKTSDITLTTDLLTRDASGQFIRGNFVRVGNDSGGSFQLQVRVTLASLQSGGKQVQQLVVGTDELDVSGLDDTIRSFGYVVVPKSKQACFTETNNGWLGITSSQFTTCNGAVVYKNNQRNTINIGDSVYGGNGQSTVTRSLFDQLGIKTIADSNPQAYDEIYIIPFVEGEPDKYYMFTGAGKSMYVQLYSTSVIAALHQTDARPQGMPLPGANTGAGDRTDYRGSPLLGFINKFIGAIIGLLQEIVYAVFYWLLAPLIQAMLSIHTYTDAFAGVIYPGWVVIRNVCNIIFIIALIAIALGTLFRVEAYQYRHLLVQLIIAALMVNFSLVIAQAILGLADTIQSQFLPNNVEVIRSLAKDLMVGYREVVWNMDFAAQGYFADVVQPLFYLALSLGSFGVFAAIAAFLMVRVVVLWILMMISPIAYVAGVLPATAKYRGEWWSNFIKYAFFTPIMAFFLNMAALMVKLQQNNPILNQIMENPSSLAGGGVDGSQLAAFVVKVASNLLLLVFLVVSLKVADSFGIYGAHAITGIAQKGIFAPFAAAGLGMKAGGGALARMYVKTMAEKKAKAEDNKQHFRKNLFTAAAMLHPKVLKEAWAQRAHELDEEAFEPAIGDARDGLNRFMPTEWQWKKKLGLPVRPTGLGRQTGYGKIAREAIINHKVKEWDDIPASEEEKVELEKNAKHVEDMIATNRMLIDGRHEDGRMLLAALQKREKRVKELLPEKFNEFKAQGKDDDMAKALAVKAAEEQAAEEIPAEYDSVKDLMKVYARMAHHGLTPHQLGKIASSTDEHCEATKKLRQMGWGVYEDHEKGFRTADDFGGYKSLEDQKGRHEMLKALASMDIFEEEDMEVVTTPDGFVDAIKFKIKDSAGNVVDTKEVKDYASFQEAVKFTDDFEGADGKGVNDETNIRYQLAGARMAASRQKRLERGNFEDTIKALEPAAMMKQDSSGKFTGYTASGRRSWMRMPAMTAATLAQSRQAQARVLKMVGLYSSDEEDTVIDLDPYDSKTNTDGTMYHVMAETFSLNASAAAGVLKKAKLKDDEVDKIVTNLNIELRKPEMVEKHGKHVIDPVTNKRVMDPATGKPLKLVRQVKLGSDKELIWDDAYTLALVPPGMTIKK